MKPELKIERKKSYYRQKLNSFLINRTFQFILKLCVFLNVVCLAIYYDEAPLAYRTFLKITGTIFAFIYTLEAILKIVAFGFKAYFSNSIYVFEFLLACFYILDSLTEFIFLPDFYTSIDQQSLYLIRISRIFRLLPLFRLIQYLKGVFKIFKTLSMSFSLLFHLFFLLLLTYFIYAVIGCFFFKKVIQGRKIDENVNFQNIFNAIITLFKCTTSDDWAALILDTSNTEPDCQKNIDCGSSIIYFKLFF